jgi:hypothetical protein
MGNLDELSAAARTTRNKTLDETDEVSGKLVPPASEHTDPVFHPGIRASFRARQVRVAWCITHRAEHWHGAMVPSKFDEPPSVATVIDEQITLPFLSPCSRAKAHSCSDLPRGPERSAVRPVVTLSEE